MELKLIPRIFREIFGSAPGHPHFFNPNYATATVSEILVGSTQDTYAKKQEAFLELQQAFVTQYYSYFTA